MDKECYHMVNGFEAGGQAAHLTTDPETSSMSLLCCKHMIPLDTHKDVLCLWVGVNAQISGKINIVIHQVAPSESSWFQTFPSESAHFNNIFWTLNFSLTQNWG